MEQQPDEMKTLYDDFVGALNGGADLSRFSKDDLLDVYDYSRSVPDDYVALEALMCGSRLYPRSRDLRKRLALYMHDLGRDDVARRISARLPESSVIRRCADIDSLDLLAGDKERFHALFNGVVPGSLEDGDILYIIDVLEDNGYISMLYDFTEELSKLCQYPTTVYHELYHTYLENRDYDKALALGTKLTELEPFNIRFWVELANLQSNYLYDYGAALETIEYALAIEPDSTEALLSKANALYSVNFDEAMQLAVEIDRKNPDNPPVIYFLAHLAFQKGDNERGLKLMHDYLDLVPNPDKDFFDTLFAYNQLPLPPEFKKALRTLLTLGPETNIDSWCTDLLLSKAYGGIIEIIDSGVVTSMSEELLLMVAEAYYRLELYDTLADFILGRCCYGNNQFGLDATYALIYAMARFAAGKTQGLADYVDAVVDNFDKSLNEADPRAVLTLMHEASLSRLKELSKFLHGDKSVEFNDYSPFADYTAY